MQITEQIKILKSIEIYKDEWIEIVKEIRNLIDETSWMTERKFYKYPMLSRVFQTLLNLYR